MQTGFKIKTNHKLEFWPAFKVDKNQIPPKASRTAISIGKWADQYLSFSPKTRYLDKGRVKKIEVQGYAWKTVAKVISFVLTLLILPGIALIAKTIYKDYCAKNLKFEPDASDNKQTTATDPTKNVELNQEDGKTPKKTKQPKNSVTPHSSPTGTTDADVKDLKQTPSDKTTPKPLEKTTDKAETTETNTPIDANNLVAPPSIDNVVLCSFKIGETTIHLKMGDIAKDHSEALVNPARDTLIAGAEVISGFKNNAGNDVFDECSRIKEQLGMDKFRGRLLTNQVVMTTAGQLKQAKVILHAVAPIQEKNSDPSGEKIKTFIENCLKTAAGIDLQEQFISEKLEKHKTYKTIALPPIATYFRYEIPNSAQVTVETVAKFIQENPQGFNEINFVFQQDSKKDKPDEYVKAFETHLRNVGKVQEVLDAKEKIKDTVYAADSINQYSDSVKGVASCTHFCFCFVASDADTTRESIKSLLEKNVQPGDTHLQPQRCLELLKDKLELYNKHPLGMTSEGVELGIDASVDLTQVDIKGKMPPCFTETDFESFNVPIEDKAMKQFLRYLLLCFKNNEFDGCVLSSFSSIALRKFNGQIELFDPHGPHEPLTKEPYGRPAYAVRFPNLENDNAMVDQILQYLKERYGDPGADADERAK